MELAGTISIYCRNRQNLAKKEDNCCFGCQEKASWFWNFLVFFLFSAVF